jgi:hypothetical protein
LDAFGVEDLGGSYEIRLLFELLVFDEPVGFDFGAVEDQLSSQFYKIKPEPADLFGVFGTPVHEVELDSLL